MTFKEDLLTDIPTFIDNDEFASLGEVVGTMFLNKAISNYTASSTITITANSVSTQHGPKTAYKVEKDGTLGSHSLNSGNISPVDGTTYGVDFIIKAGGSTQWDDYVRLGFHEGGWAGTTASIISGPGILSPSTGLYILDGLSQTEWTHIRMYRTSAGGSMTLRLYPGGTTAVPGAFYIYNLPIYEYSIGDSGYGIFDNESQSVEHHDGSTTSPSPMFLCNASDFPDIAFGSVFVTNKAVYEVVDEFDDGTGPTTFMLELQ